VLDSQNADTKNYPASLTKMMTLYLVFEALHDGRLSWNQRITMSKRGAAVIPSKLWVKAGTTFTVREAVYGMIVKSANDMAEGMGDHLGGSQAGFAQMMTRKARALGMTRTIYKNASGLPNDQQITTARDQSILGRAVQERFPTYYKYFQTRSFTFRGRSIGNHNNLLGRVEGVDGIKTGYIKASGFNIVTSYDADGRKLIVVVMGADSARQRNDHVEALIQRSLSPTMADTKTRLMFAGDQPAASPLPGLPSLPAPQLPGLPPQ
jgi:D-alanyl-D-alanine carboxypeptidase